METNKDIIYLLRCGEFPYYKIGITSNLTKRISQIQNGNPFPLSIVFTCTNEDAPEVESVIKKAYKRENIRGEWFYFEISTIETIIKYMVGKK